MVAGLQAVIEKAVDADAKKDLKADSK